MKGTIGFDQHKIFCIIGIYPYEREKEQEIFVDLKVELDFAVCVHEDDFAKTFNYVTLAEICTQIAQEGKFKLLETLAYTIIQKLIQEFNVSWAWIKIRKPSAIPSAQCATVELMHRRDS